MRNLPIKIIRCGTLDNSELIEIIKERLQEMKKYKPTLMYRGLATNEDGLRTIQMYGTDRNPHTATRAFFATEEMILEGDLTPEVIDYQQQTCNPNGTWVFPEEDLEKCIEEYVAPDDEKPTLVILVYRGDHLVVGLKDDKNYGFTLDQVRGDHCAEGFYLFKPGKTARDAFVAAFQLDY